MTGLIPTIDLTPFLTGGAAGQRAVARQIDEACRETGFFLVAGHGVSDTLVAAARQSAVEFFALPLDEKMRVQRPPERISRGYFWVGDRSVSYSLGKSAPPDLQEAYALGPDDVPDAMRRTAGPGAPMLAPNLWPERPARFRETLLAYRAAMSDLAASVLRAMAAALEVEERCLLDAFDHQSSTVRIIRYPAQEGPALPGQLRSGEHTDYGTITLVRGDDTPGGLQVKHRNGGWIDVHPPAGAFVCNLGDLMMRWTNDRWVSTLHRVAVPPEGAAPQDRISLVFFQIPNHDAVISCIPSCAGPGRPERYAPITCAEHYLGKYMKAAHRRLDAGLKDSVAAAGE